jgi:hypothetical protein
MGNYILTKSQINNPLNQNQSIGDDETSYAYDGYRMLKLNKSGMKESETYGDIWDIGDIIGCCIDLDKREIEYFKNGESLGISFYNIPIGKNIAYFPAASISKGMRLLFNFGEYSLQYSYSGYNTIDIPPALYTGKVSCIIKYLELLDCYFLKLLAAMEISVSIKRGMTWKIFAFISNVALCDDYLVDEIIIPYMRKLLDNTDHFKIFCNYLFEVPNFSENSIKNLIHGIFILFSPMSQD